MLSRHFRGCLMAAILIAFPATGVADRLSPEWQAGRAKWNAIADRALAGDTVAIASLEAILIYMIEDRVTPELDPGIAEENVHDFAPALMNLRYLMSKQSEAVPQDQQEAYTQRQDHFLYLAKQMGYPVAMALSADDATVLKRAADEGMTQSALAISERYAGLIGKAVAEGTDNFLHAEAVRYAELALETNPTQTQAEKARAQLDALTARPIAPSASVPATERAAVENEIAAMERAIAAAAQNAPIAFGEGCGSQPSVSSSVSGYSYSQMSDFVDDFNVYIAWLNCRRDSRMKEAGTRQIALAPKAKIEEIRASGDTARAFVLGASWGVSAEASSDAASLGYYHKQDLLTVLENHADWQSELTGHAMERAFLAQFEAFDADLAAQGRFVTDMKAQMAARYDVLEDQSRSGGSSRPAERRTVEERSPSEADRFFQRQQNLGQCIHAAESYPAGQGREQAISDCMRRYN